MDGFGRSRFGLSAVRDRVYVGCISSSPHNLAMDSLCLLLRF